MVLPGRLLTVAALALALLSSGRVVAEEPPHPTYSPAPPGTVVQSQVVYLTGEAMHSQWRAVVSKSIAGNNATTAFYHWYLSIYAIDGDGTYRLKYRSPQDGGPLAPVTRVAGGGEMWFPIEDVKIAGTPELMAHGVQTLVVQSHSMAADCGEGTVTVFTANAQGKVVPAVSLQNGCDLSAKVLTGKSGALDALQLSGPYYAPNAAMCCPTKPKATATLQYANGTWSQTPKYYQAFVGAFPPR